MFAKTLIYLLIGLLLNACHPQANTTPSGFELNLSNPGLHSSFIDPARLSVATDRTTGFSDTVPLALHNPPAAISATFTASEANRSHLDISASPAGDYHRLVEDRAATLTRSPPHFFRVSDRPADSAAVQPFYIGHSLTDYIPEMIASWTKMHWGFQSIPGAPLRWQWQRMAAADLDSYPPHAVSFYHPDYGLPSGGYTALILTESVPRRPENLEETFDYAGRFVNYVLGHNPATRIFVYEVWHCIRSGTPTGCDYDIDSRAWRQRLDDDLPMWESVVADLNRRFDTTQPVCLIPGGQGLARLYDAIMAGTVPGLSQLEDIFEDDIHLNDIGRYFVSALHYGILFQESPVGLNHQVYNQWGGLFAGPNQQQATRLQQIALETLLDESPCFQPYSSSFRSLYSGKQTG